MTRPKSDPNTRYASRITPEQAEKVRRDRAAGVTITEIARVLGVRRSSIQDDLGGRTHRAPIPAEPAKP